MQYRVPEGWRKVVAEYGDSLFDADKRQLVVKEQQQARLREIDRFLELFYSPFRVSGLHWPERK